MTASFGSESDCNAGHFSFTVPEKVVKIVWLKEIIIFSDEQKWDS